VNKTVFRSQCNIAIAFLAGFLASFPVYSILPLEIIAIVSSLFSRNLLLNSFRNSVAGAGSLYLSALALLVSSLANNTPLVYLLKGILALPFFVVTLTYMVQRFKAHEIWFALLSYNAFSAVFAIRQHSVHYDSNIQASFKFGYSGLLLFLILSLPLLLKPSLVFKSPNILYTKSLSSPFFVYPASLIIALLALWGNLRLLIFCNVFALLSWNFSRLGAIERRRLLRNLISSKIFIGIAIPLGLIIASLAFTAFVRSAIYSLSLYEFISNEALVKTLEQSTGSLGVLFGGRVEIFASLLAWHDKPFFGWGAWPIDPNRTYALSGFQIMEDLGYKFSELAFLIDNVANDVALPWIPTHSFLFQSLVWSGIFGFVPSYWFLCSILSRFLCMSSRHTPFLIHFLHSLAIWSMLFSPFGWPNRINLALILAFVLSALSSENAMRFSTKPNG
jgi:hypothetical protein